jgi:hypothetical protein
MSFSKRNERYLSYPRAHEGVCEQLEDVLSEVRTIVPDAYMEGSTGFERSFFNAKTRLLVGMAWSNWNRPDSGWKFVVFRDGQDW